MFARTSRLTLRPGWPEDAPAIARAAAHHAVARMLTNLPWPYDCAHAEAWLAAPRGKRDAYCLILCHDHGYPEPIGAISLTEREDRHHLGYWLTPSAWGRGYATEAGQAMLAIGHHALGLAKVRASHFVDNPASGKVLAKLGFSAVGETLLTSHARDYAAPSIVLERDLRADATSPVSSLAA